jgi:methylglutaconyl-CoA hydratase
VGETVDTLLAGGPSAQAECKSLVAAVAGRPIDDDLIDETARRITRVRAGAEAREGMAAFFERRGPNWSGEQRKS